MTTSQWIVFGVVEPAIVLLLALLALFWHQRTMRTYDREHPEGEIRKNDETIAGRVADLERTLNALLSGASGWPDGLIDIGVKRLETSIEALQMSDQELAELSASYQEIADKTLGPTSSALMIEAARRSTLTAYQRMAEAAERARER